MVDRRIDKTRLAAFFSLASALIASGCVTSTAVHEPRNYQSLDENAPRAELRKIHSKHAERVDLSRTLNRQRCAAPLLNPAGANFSSDLDCLAPV